MDPVEPMGAYGHSEMLDELSPEAVKGGTHDSGQIVR